MPTVNCTLSWMKNWVIHEFLDHSVYFTKPHASTLWENLNKINCN